MNPSRFFLLPVMLLACLASAARPHPYGFLETGKGFYIEECEVTLHKWMVYYVWTYGHEGAEAAAKLMPDSNVMDAAIWKQLARSDAGLREIALVHGGSGMQEIEFQVSMVMYARQKEVYKLWPNTPVTGITYEQAISYCKWRTRCYGNNRWSFRLPSPGEWTSVAQENEKWYADSLMPCKKYCPRFNFKGAISKKLSGFDTHVFPVATPRPEKPHKTYDMFGNVAEITDEKGIAKGGSYMHYAAECAPGNVQQYSAPGKWLGFRCIAEVKK